MFTPSLIIKGKRTNFLDGGTTVPPDPFSTYRSPNQIQLSRPSVTEEMDGTSAENADSGPRRLTKSRLPIPARNKSDFCRTETFVVEIKVNFAFSANGT
jgi:hypothetical protein